MKRFTLSAITTIALALAVPQLLAQEDQNSMPDDRGLNDKLNVFTPYEGTWTCNSPWETGNEFWAQNVYSVGMNGNFFEAITSTKNESGGNYQRYKTTWLYNKESEKLETYGFTYDGTVTITYPEIVNSSDGNPIIRSQWKQASGTTIKQEVQMNRDEKSYQWRVWSSADGKTWNQMMDGVWKKSN